MGIIAGITFLLIMLAAAYLSNDRESAIVVRVIDGDTIVVRMNHKEHKVRLLYIDTPEIGEPGAAKATRYVEKLLQPQDVIWMERDKQNKDRYGRLLRVIYTDKNDRFRQSVNYMLWESGNAKKLIVEPNFKHERELRR